MCFTPAPRECVFVGEKFCLAPQVYFIAAHVLVRISWMYCFPGSMWPFILSFVLQKWFAKKWSDLWPLNLFNANINYLLKMSALINAMYDHKKIRRLCLVRAFFEPVTLRVRYLLAIIVRQGKLSM